MNNMENMEQFIIRQGGHSEALQLARNQAQVELAEASGQDLIKWVDKYSKSFDMIVTSNPEILDRLAENGTHNEALEEVKKEIYH